MGEGRLQAQLVVSAPVRTSEETTEVKARGQGQGQGQARVRAVQRVEFRASLIVGTARHPGIIVHLTAPMGCTCGVHMPPMASRSDRWAQAHAQA